MITQQRGSDASEKKLGRSVHGGEGISIGAMNASGGGVNINGSGQVTLNDESAARARAGGVQEVESVSSTESQLPASSDLWPNNRHKSGARAQPTSK